MGTPSMDLGGCAVVHRGAETRDYDYKGPCSWSPKDDKKACCELTKDIVAMANTAGGILVIGVDEEQHRFTFTGLQPEQAKTWETTSMNEFVNNYVDPPINCTLQQIECEGRLFVAIRIPPFSFTPHLITKDYPGALARFTLYVRTANNASAPIADSVDFNTLVERAIKIRRGEMLDAVLVILPEFDKAIARKAGEQINERERTQVMRRAERAAPILRDAQILWVDDHPEYNLHERRILRSLGVFVDLARTTDEALAMLRDTHYDMIISDMERGGVGNAGVKLVSSMRDLDLQRPTVFYTSYVDESRGTPTYTVGITARPDHLLHYVMDILERERG